MIDIASRAQDGVRIPGKKATRDEIKDLFQQRMAALKKKLNVRRVPFSFFFFTTNPNRDRLSPATFILQTMRGRQRTPTAILVPLATGLKKSRRACGNRGRR
jgi:hypothetical protein